jgi:hypothetical protein
MPRPGGANDRSSDEKVHRKAAVAIFVQEGPPSGSTGLPGLNVPVGRNVCSELYFCVLMIVLTFGPK